MAVINTEQARLDLDALDREINETELRVLELRERRSELATFLRLCDTYFQQRIPDMRENHTAGDTTTETGVVGGDVNSEAKPESEPVATPALETPSAPVTPTAFARRSDYQKPPFNLKREKGNRQTQVAEELVRRYEPGAILTIHEAADRLRLPFGYPSGSHSKVHHLSSFMTREADCPNGVLERIEPGKYRLKDNARELVPVRILPT